MMKRIFSLQKKSVVYSLISLLNVGCGLGVTGLIWYRYSTSGESDILLLAISSISILAQLSLVGVEQVLYFYADERKKHEKDAEKFFKVAFTWSLMSGLLFALAVVVLAKYFVALVGPGLSESSQHLTVQLLLSLTPQLVMSPSLHVLRAKLAQDEKFGRAYLLSAANSFVVLICLVAGILGGIFELAALAKLSLFIFLFFLLAYLVINRGHLIWLSRDDWKKVRGLVVHSAAIKGANATHNFLVQALLSSLLSVMPTGSISIYQYAKKLADGVFAITAGPQVMIYHSKCALAVSRWDLRGMRANMEDFLKSFLGLFLAMALMVYLVAPLALSIVAKNFSPQVVVEIRWAYVGIALWYLIMGIETLSVGIILAMRSSVSLFIVNFTFIFLFFLWSRFHTMGSVLELIFTTVGFQVLSFILFTFFALGLIRSRSLSAR